MDHLLVQHMLLCMLRVDFLLLVAMFDAVLAVDVGAAAGDAEHN